MRILFSLLLSLMFCLSIHGQSQERIISFHSDIKIDVDGRIEVAEHIKVYAAGNEIKRGIKRELPLSRKNKFGKRVRMDNKILSVRCNDVDTKYKKEEEGGNLIIYIGDEDVLLAKGEYNYTLIYESYGHILFDDKVDELYWNVTGNKSVFSIEKASATVTLPADSKAIRTYFYTGIEGAKEQDCTVEDRGNVQVFATTRPLKAKEGLTIAVAFPRDIISRPLPPTEKELLWNNYGYIFCGLAGGLICILFFFLSILKVGKKPEKPVAIPTFKPPRDLSPASVLYLSKRQYDKKAFTATLIEMAVKGAMSIRCGKKKKYSLLNKMNTELLRPEELNIHEAIFAGSDGKAVEKLKNIAETNPDLKGNLSFIELQKQLSEPEVEVDQKNYEKFSKANKILQTSMGKQWKLQDYYKENNGHIALSGFLLNVIFVLYIIFTGATEEVACALALASPFIALEIVFLCTAIPRFEIGCASIFLGVSITFLFVGSVLAGLVDDGSDMDVHWLSAAFFTVMSLLYMWYCRRVRFMTDDGAKLSSELEGFKMYMKTAEEHRLNMLTPPERTPELFEKLLPYAMALGVSNEWCKKFNDVLKKFNYSPEWYDGDEDFTVAGFATTFVAMNTSFSSSVTSASTSSGSSDWDSGSGGGGSSGGGGGGGGVGGW